MTTLENSYCRPNGVEEWAAIDALNPRIELRIKGRFVFTLKDNGKRQLWVGQRKKGNAKEIPVTRFLDLLNDRIVSWRLEEVGFDDGCPKLLKVQGSVDRHVIAYSSGGIWVNGARYDNLTTFSDLLTLIKFLTPREGRLTSHTNNSPFSDD